MRLSNSKGKMRTVSILKIKWLEIRTTIRKKYWIRALYFKRINSIKSQTPIKRVSSNSNNNPLNIITNTKDQRSKGLISFITTAFFRYKKSKETAVKTNNSHSSLKYLKDPKKYSERRSKGHSDDQYSMSKG